MKFCPIKSLQHPLVLPNVANVSGLWHASGLLCSHNQPRPNWSGFVQSACEGKHPGPASINLLSIIDVILSDENCIYSTLIFIKRQAQFNSVRVPCVQLTNHSV